MFNRTMQRASSRQLAADDVAMETYWLLRSSIDTHTENTLPHLTQVIGYSTNAAVDTRLTRALSNDL